MLGSAIFVAITALVAGSSAVAIPNPNERYVQLRLYGKPGCSELNLGELGVYGTEVNKCNTFGEEKVRSVLLQYNPHGCKVRTYSDLKCKLTRHDLKLDQCLSGDKEYRSYEVICKV
ncbi:hypothetical protein BGZ63DRAFT_421384 [Mariannaea sp. PMI_226]|nr:hypothetical protein BGZ63DRAFT_421384 [Mariannaea sp. PMI_226]